MWAQIFVVSGGVVVNPGLSASAVAAVKAKRATAIVRAGISFSFMFLHLIPVGRLFTICNK